MRNSFTYILILILFGACVMNSDIIPGNLTENIFGFVSRNVQKERSELFEDMKEITKQGLIYFEVYDEAGELIATLSKPNDFTEEAIATFDKSKYLIKSISKAQVIATSLPEFK